MRRLATTRTPFASLGLIGAAALWICLALLATPASAVFSYPSPQTLSDAGQNASDPKVAIDASGRATIVWQRSDGSNTRVQSVRLAADGTPGAVQTLSDAGRSVSGPKIAIDGSDRATIVWERRDGTGLDNWRVQSVRLAANGTPGAVQTLSEAGQDARNPEVAIDSSDRATVTWDRNDGSDRRVQSVRLAADGTPGAVQTLSDAGRNAVVPAVAIDDSDRATIVWRRSDGTNDRIQSVRLGADGTPEAVKTLSQAGQEAAFPQVAVDGSDRATITWRRSDGTNERVQSVRLAADGTPEAIKTLSQAGQNASGPKVAIDGSDRATIIWSRETSTGANRRIQAVRLAADGTPGAVQTLSDIDADDSELTIDDSDRATITWEGEVGPNRRIQAVRLGADGSPGTVRTLSEAGQNALKPAIAIDGSELATIAWGRGEPFNVGGSDVILSRIQATRAEIVYPQTTITSGPSGLTNGSSPSFGFSSSAGGPSFECRLDSGAWSACTTPKSYASLSDGPHTFAVRAVDVEDDADPTPAERSFSVDTTPPQTTITSGPSGVTSNSSPSFGFDSDEAGSTFECRLDSASFAPCTSLKSYSNLAEGAHTFRVRATDQATNTDPTPAERSFSVDAKPPQTTITSGPSGITGNSSPSFGFASDEPGSTFECRLDSASFAPCSSPNSYPNLPDGPHTFRVRATDPEGSTDPSPAERAFSVDTTPPQTTITSGPSGTTGNSSPSFGFTASEPGSSFECRLDAASFAPCTSLKSYSNLPDGPHAFRVRATDPRGNTDASPAVRVFTVDTGPPPRPLPSPLPIATDTVLEGSATAKKKQMQKGKKIVVEVKVKANEDLDAKASGTIKVNPTYEFKSESAVVSSGKSKLLKLKPKKRKDAEKIVKALKRGKKATAKLTVKLIDGFGNRKVQKLSVNLKHRGAR